jgi:hypothetical protein
VIKCTSTSEEYTAFTFRVNEPVQVDAEKMQYRKTFWLNKMILWQVGRRDRNVVRQ